MNIHLSLYGELNTSILGNEIERSNAGAFPAVLEILTAITPTITPEALDNVIEKYSEYDFKSFLKGPNNTRNGLTALHAAVQVNNLEVVKFLLKKFGKEYVNVVNFNGETALFTALRSTAPKSDTILRFLINSGANVNQPVMLGSESHFCKFPLDVAVKLGVETKIQILLNSGAQYAYIFSKVAVNFLFMKPPFSTEKMHLFSKGTRIDPAFNPKSNPYSYEAIQQRFQFFLGSKDPESTLSRLPKELITHILVNPRYPHLRIHTLKMLMDVIAPGKSVLWRKP